MHTSTLAGSLVALAFACAASGQATWTQVVGNEPAGRSLHAMVYDAQLPGIVLFGGFTNPGPAGDTWLGISSAWFPLGALTGPSARIRHAMAYDSARQRTVLFSGLSLPSGPLADTWEFNSGTLTWSQANPTTSPPSRQGHAMVFDAARQRVVLFGGIGTITYGDTWEYDGLTWTQRTPAAAPPARNGHAMAYDSARQRTVLYGGWNGSLLADTWEWDGNSWVAKFTLSYPPARLSTALAYDALRQRVVLFGGDGNPGFLGDTWEFNGTTWTQLSPTLSPSSRWGHAMAYNATLHRVVLFGGTNGPAIGGTWINGPLPAFAVANAYGNGCGSPALGLLPDANGRPVIGQQASATIVDTPTLAAAMSIGWSNTAFGPFALPVTLAGIGMPGCELLQSADVTSLGVTPLTSTTLRFALPLPNSQSLLGTQVFLQAYAFAPGANPLEVVVSNGVAWTIGDT